MAKLQWDPFDWQALSSSGPVIGVDEVGRGCLAGRVYAAAVVLDEQKEWRRYTDSKTLSAKRRDVFAEQILKDHHVGIGFATVEEIDRLNILKASLLAMRRAVLELNLVSGHLLVDGKFPVPEMPDFQQTTLIKGDLRASPVAAASIVAKVTRDRWITELGERYPHYGFSQHKGYSTLAHKDAIREWGPCPEHRKSFAGVREYL